MAGRFLCLCLAVLPIAFAIRSEVLKRGGVKDDCNEDCVCAEEKCKACPSQITRFEGACWCTGCPDDPFKGSLAEFRAAMKPDDCNEDCVCAEEQCRACPSQVSRFEGACWCTGCPDDPFKGSLAEFRATMKPDDCNEDCVCAEEQCKACPSQVSRFEGACWCTGCPDDPFKGSLAEFRATMQPDDCNEDCVCAEEQCKACPSQVSRFEGACWCTGCPDDPFKGSLAEVKGAMKRDDCNEDCVCAEERCKACPSQVTRFEGACWCTGCPDDPFA